MIIEARELRRGDVIIARIAVPEWTSRALVLAARWYPTYLSLDLQWLKDGKIVTGCALSANESFFVERGETDPVIEAARTSFSAYCKEHGL